MSISKIAARMILDSRGNPTVEADVVVNGRLGRASVPSGASTGDREAKELRDGGEAYGGLGVKNALENINAIAPKLVGKEFSYQAAFDDFLNQLDSTEDKSKLGANAVLALSLAFAKAKARSNHQHLFEYANQLVNGSRISIPTPMFNVLNGGKHAKGSSDIQEYMIVPRDIDSYEKQLQAGTEIFHTLGKILYDSGHSTAVGDEGGYLLPKGKKNQDGFELLVEAITAAGYEPGKEVFIAIDAAASEFFSKGRYIFKTDGKKLSADELIDIYHGLVDKYPLISIEDGLEENDWHDWSELTEDLGNKIMLVGDDLLTTNPKYIKKDIREKACNSVLIKPNQIGTLTETAQAVELAHKNGMTTIMSHRSGETEDVTIAHLAVGFGCKYIKSGSLSRSERLAKYNELLRINNFLQKY